MLPRVSVQNPAPVRLAPLPSAGSLPRGAARVSAIGALGTSGLCTAIAGARLIPPAVPANIAGNSPGMPAMHPGLPAIDSDVQDLRGLKKPRVQVFLGVGIACAVPFCAPANRRSMGLR